MTNVMYALGWACLASGLGIIAVLIVDEISEFKQFMNKRKELS